MSPRRIDPPAASASSGLSIDGPVKGPIEAWADAWFDGGDEPGADSPRKVWTGWPLRMLVIATLAACMAMLLFIRLTAATPVLLQSLALDTNGAITIARHGEEARMVTGLRDHDDRPIEIDATLFELTPRWIADDGLLRHTERLHDAFATALAAGPVTWSVAEGVDLVTRARPLGVAGLGAVFWLMATLALVLYLVVMVTVLARPSLRNLLYALATLPQAANLLFIAFESAVGIHMPAGFAHADHTLRGAFDMVSAAAIAHSAALYPRPLPWRRWLTPIIWGLTLPMAMLTLTHQVRGSWWIVQATFIALGLLALGQFAWSYRIERHPLTLLFQRFGAATLAVFILFTLGVGMASLKQADTGVLRAVGAAVWAIFLSTMLVATPFSSRTQPMIREFSMLAGVSTMATALDLIFVAVFSLGDFASLTLALFLSLMVYAGVRQWILDHMLQPTVLTTERMFEQVYRIARDAEAHPQRLREHFSRLLRELYDPIDALPLNRSLAHSRVAGGGAMLMVPVPGAGTDPARAIVLRYAHRGKRLFTPEDGRLTDRLVEQLARAVAFDQAVERGRSEERVRIAQDLHDDIGARLLTLMYKAPDSEVEDYIRHTLHELKTLTRGLAAIDHRLSHAVAEWKSDMTHRLGVARCELDWAFTFDEDVMLTVVQWSAVTRIIRELINNVIAHGKASHVSLNARLADRQLRIRVADDGVGRMPQQWDAGLGLGGIRKRVKQLAGQVRWEENSPQGIVCVVDLRLDGAGAAAA